MTQDYSEYDPVDESVEVEVHDVNVGVRYQQRLPADVLNKHDLRETLVNMAIGQGDISFSATDVKINEDGQFSLPKRKSKVYGLNQDRRMTVYIDRVWGRK